MHRDCDRLDIHLPVLICVDIKGNVVNSLWPPSVHFVLALFELVVTSYRFCDHFWACCSGLYFAHRNPYQL